MALAALFVLSAIGTSAAQAASSLDIGSSPAIITASQVLGNPLKLVIKKETGSETLGTVKCSIGNLQGTTTGLNVTDVTLTPTYGGCTFGGIEAAVKTNCRYTLTNTATAKLANVDFLGTKISEHIEQLCTTEVVQGGCVITIDQFHNSLPLSHIALENVATSSPTHVQANLTISMIAWGGGAGCPANIANVNGTNAELTGPTTVKAFVDVGGGEGAQIALEAT